MRWMSFLFAASVILLLTSCAHSPTYTAVTSGPAPSSACRTPCRIPPEPTSSPRDSVKRLLRWADECKSLHDECVVSQPEDADGKRDAD